MARNESLSSIDDDSMCDRRVRKAFLLRGLRSKVQAEKTDTYYIADEAMHHMGEILTKARAKLRVTFKSSV
ncbi:hypothetical protein [Dyella sp.]|uniref:hypothetical protein n=1 Tax=Dyella sp. TaxID=1869338 RepID=UPI002D76DA09|nr:hypothetical protein [Dyella sp.]HET7329703.1 hypothetical protein [Dyella sp.]